MLSASSSTCGRSPSYKRTASLAPPLPTIRTETPAAHVPSLSAADAPPAPVTANAGQLILPKAAAVAVPNDDEADFVADLFDDVMALTEEERIALFT